MVSLQSHGLGIIMGFVHLHVHSQYSFLDGASSIDNLLQKAIALDMPALAITDHNRLTGAIRFYVKAKELGIKPIIGAEIDLEGGYHLTLLCKDAEGYSNLCQLITKAHLSNRNSKPKAIKKMLQEHHEGLIALSGCDKGEIPTLISEGNTKKAHVAASAYRDMFGEDFYIELIRYRSREWNPILHTLSSFASEESIPTVATNNVHYADFDDYKVKELLNAIQKNTPVYNLSGARTSDQYLR
jgi:DNA polymerase III alpha subunit